VGRDTDVSVATHYRLDGLGIKSQWGGEIFHTHPDWAHQPPTQWVPGKVAGMWHVPPTTI
jgi:hypothetical protein